MVKISIAKILNASTGLKKLVDEQLPAKVAYRVKRVMDAVSSESNHIEKTRVALVQKYADEQTPEQKEKGEGIRVSKKLKEFQEEFAPFLDEEVELNCYKIDFNDIETVKLSVQELVSLEPFLNIPEDADLSSYEEEFKELEKKAPEEVETETVDKTETDIIDVVDTKTAE